MNEELTWTHLISSLVEGRDLSVTESGWAMESIIAGSFAPVQLAAFLVGLAAKGETVDEIIGLRDAALRHAVPLKVDPVAVDIVGTGGDRHNTVNVSTMAAVVVAASGIPVVKFGNRAVSSKSGSSDLLAALGIQLDLPPKAVASLVDRVGITFALAPLFYPGFKNAAPVRGELGIPTVFNILGPLCNPATPRASAVGVAHRERAPLVAGVFQARDATAIVFRGHDGLDELTTTGSSHMWEVCRGTIREREFDPRDVGISLASLDDLRGGTADENARIFRTLLAGREGPIRDIVLLNAAIAMVAFDLDDDPSLGERELATRVREKIEAGEYAIDSGAAEKLVDKWVRATNKS